MSDKIKGIDKKEYHKQYYQKNKEKQLKEAKDRYKENKDLRKKQVLKYYYKNQEEILTKRNTEEAKEKKKQANKDLYHRDYEKSLARAKANSRTPEGRYSHTKSRAKKYGKEFAITLEQFTETNSKPCYYCNDKYRANEQTGSGLDRLDNSKGYVPGNIVSCCGHCNYLKSDCYSPAETFRMIEILNDPNIYWLSTIKEYFEANKASFIKDRSHERGKIIPMHDGSLEDKRRYETAHNRSLKGRYRVFKGNAKKRKLVFDLTFDQFADEALKPCAYCSDYFRIVDEHSSACLDRIDNTKGYEVGNILSSCQHCNYLKNDFYSVQQTQLLVLALMHEKGAI